MNRAKPRTGVGASSILLIIVVLSLTTFGVLTLVSARIDAELTARTIETTEVYYMADAAAQRKLMEIDAALAAGTRPEAIEGLTPSESTEGGYTFQIETGDERAIRITILCDAGGESRYTVVEYRLIPLSDWGGQEEIHFAAPAK